MSQDLPGADWNFRTSQPPKDLSRPLQALWWLKKGGFHTGPEWDQAHTICMSMEGNKAHDWVHALVHWIAADLGNADYWYRLSGEKRAKPSVSQEWAHMVSVLSK